VLDVIFGRRAEYRRANAASCDSRKLGRAFAGGPLAHTFRRARPLLDFAKAAKARPRLLDLSGLCEALRTPTPPWTPTLPRQMMCATPIVGAVMDIVVWLRSLVLGSTRRSSAYQWMGVARHDQNWLENGRKNDG
jgi:hypothetical protein